MTIDLKEKLDSDSEKKVVFDLDKELEKLSIRERTVFEIQLDKVLGDLEWYAHNGLDPKDPHIKTKAGRIIYESLFKEDPHFTPSFRVYNEFY